MDEDEETETVNPNTGGNGGAEDEANKNIDPATTPADKDTGADKDKAPESVPYSRFKEVNGKMKDYETELAELRKEKAERLAAEKKAEEDEAKKKGEYEKLIETKEQELAEYKSKEAQWAEREKVVAEKNDTRIASLKEQHGEDLRSTAESLIAGIDDPFLLANKLDAVEAMLGNATKKGPQGGGDVPDAQDGGKLEAYDKRLEKGERLSISEEKEYLRLLAKTKK